MPKGLRSAPRINGVAYSWSDVQMLVLDVPVFGVTSINYAETQEMDNIYGLSTYPVAQGYGQINMEGSITMHADEIEAITASARAQGYEKLQDIPEFDIIVIFKPDNAAKLVTHRINNCTFKSNNRNFSQGDLAIEVDMDLLFSHVDWNI